ncbi:hypothetical protein C5167_049361 [Papaver somniferum]|uniref:Uncharacterized protein n=1 Tax=Papaver somniferum TaxID=3469 RepID=A0A4Y7KNG5_PAPSO|nr:hypothetical protein C5167_049361 [Papaver somniferum]
MVIGKRKEKLLVAAIHDLEMEETSLPPDQIRNQEYVMVLLKGSVHISFCGIEENNAFGELTSIGGINVDANKKLSASILEENISVSKSCFFIKFIDTKAWCILPLETKNCVSV